MGSENTPERSRDRKGAVAIPCAGPLSYVRDSVPGDGRTIFIIEGERSPVMERSVLAVVAREGDVVYRRCETGLASLPTCPASVAVG